MPSGCSPCTRTSGRRCAGYCVGASLARAEMQEALIALARRVESLELAGQHSFGTSSGIYGLETLPLRVAWV
ncbi:MAG TPA: hypothetical protein VG325_05845 [Solirubrobacteraceae bacterium]|nr:hypothetical protein [Solirubrobacteraceae bacterium]